MTDDILDEYVNQKILLYAPPIHGTDRENEPTEAFLLDYSSTGILVQTDEFDEVFIPFHTIRMLRKKPKPSFWERFWGTGT